MTSNYDKQAETARLLFLEYDLEPIVERFGLEHDKNAVYIGFFGGRLRIDRETGSVTRAETGSGAGFHAVMSVYDALCCSKDGARLTGEWKTLPNLSPHSNFGASGKNLFETAAARLSGRVAELCAACERLGGALYTTADAGFLFNAFPFLPVVFQFWEGDDEFPSKISFLFDGGTLDFIHFETAWYVAAELLELIFRELGI